jgi:peptidoglycan hydrolase-like protein with peptidoglycan-binding domain
MKQGQQGQAQPGQAAQQGQSKQGQRGQGEQRDQTTGQAPRQQGQAPQGQASGQTGGSATGQAGNVNLTSQQRTRIQQTVLAGSNVPRVNNVNFTLSTGTVVPTSVRVVDVGPELIEINSQWRGYKYFVVHDDVVVIDNSRKIVAVVPTGSSRGGARLNTGGGSASALNLSEEQIREVQTVLIQKGFDIGRPDGRLGPRTVRALTVFQRKQGLAATGRIDNQTVTALGVSNMSGAQGGATTGQGGGAASQGGAAHQQAPAQQNQGANQPSTSGQGNATQSPAHQGANQPSSSGSGSQAPAGHKGANEPSRSGQSGASGPSTSGQGGASGQHAPAQHNQDQQSGGSK